VPWVGWSVKLNCSGLQNRQLLEELLESVTNTRDELTPVNIVSRKPKIVLKIAPDLTESQLVSIADVIRSKNIDGVIVSNTTIQRPLTLTDRSFITFLRCSCAHFAFQPIKLKPVDCPASLSSQSRFPLSGYYERISLRRCLSSAAEVS
jgi:hypothetical protein